MFTVILLTRAAREIFDPASVYFAPFVESGEIAFCDWREDARGDFHQALPSLPDVIKGKSTWRAVVVDHPRGAVATRSNDQRDEQNPFDFLDNQSFELNLSDSKHALVRVAHQLLGYPQMTAKRFIPYLQYEDSGEIRTLDLEGAKAEIRQEGAVTEQPAVDFDGGVQREVEFDFDDEERVMSRAATILGREYDQVQRQFAELPYSQAEKREHERLVAQYRMKEVRPSIVIFISSRADVVQDEKAMLKRAWRTDEEQNSSRFVERNDYPPMCRFAVYELLEEENSGYDHDLLRFWLSVLTIATNSMPSSSLQAERLHRLQVDFSTAELAEMLNSHLSDLTMVAQHVDRLLLAPARVPEMSVKDLLAPVETEIAFDELVDTEIGVSPSGYGLSSDRPTSERARWAGDIEQLRKTTGQFMRKPRRAVTRAVHQARNLARLPSDESVTLNDIERDELRDELAHRLRDIVLPATTDLLDKRRMRRVIEEGDRRVNINISQRMRHRAVIIASAVGLSTWFAVCIPYLIQCWRRGWTVLGEGAMLTLLLLAGIGLASLGALLVMRRRLRRDIGDLNDGVADEVRTVQRGAAKFARYLEEFVTYRRGADLLRGATHARDARTQRIVQLKRLRESIGEKVRLEKGIVTSLGEELNIQRTSQRLIEFDPDDRNSMRRLYRFPVGDRSIPVNESGERVRAPYDFVSKLSVKRVLIFEEKRDDEDERTL